MAPHVRVRVPGGSDVAVRQKPAHQTTVEGGDHANGEESS